MNQFGEIIEQKGGQGLNAFTCTEETGYFYSFPSNQVELWAYLESERFLHPVMREFYKERDVVHEERRLGESQPFGRLLEQFAATAYLAHPYGQPVVGWPSDLESFSATDAENFYRKYYVPANMILTLVGDVKPGEVLPIIEKYVGRLPARPKPEPLRTVEPPQNAERIVILRETSQPIFIEGYHKPGARGKDDAVYDAMQDLMSNGRTSRLFRSLVRDKKIAAFSGGLNGFPGAKYPNLFVFFAISTPGHTPLEIRDAVHVEIERVRDEDISDDELQKSSVVLLADGKEQKLAFQLGIAQSIYGDWRGLFRHVDDIAKVSKGDIRRVAIIRSWTRIVVTFDSAPARFPSTIRAYYSDDVVKGRNARAHGATAVLTTLLPEDRKRLPWDWVVPQYRMGAMRWLDNNGEPNDPYPFGGVAEFNRSGAEVLFNNAPKTLEQAFETARANQPQAFPLVWSARIHTVSSHTTYDSPNMWAGRSRPLPLRRPALSRAQNPAAWLRSSPA